MKFVLKKKKKTVLKIKTNLHSVNQKTSKGKEMNKGICTAEKIVLRNLRLNLRRSAAAIVLVEDTEVMNNEEFKI